MRASIICLAANCMVFSVTFSQAGPDSVSSGQGGTLEGQDSICPLSVSKTNLWGDEDIERDVCKLSAEELWDTT